MQSINAKNEVSLPENLQATPKESRSQMGILFSNTEMQVQKEEKSPSCGRKYDQLKELKRALENTSVHIPAFFGFSHDQIAPLFSEDTLNLWKQVQEIDKPLGAFYPKRHQLLIKVRESVKKDIVQSELLFDWKQKTVLQSLMGKPLIVRSSSNEDGKVVNAGGNQSIGGVESSEMTIKQAIAEVVSSYFSLQSLKNRSPFENPYSQLPQCSVLVMEQIVEESSRPIVSGVMMSSERGWHVENEKGITHITASWGFGSGTSREITCDEWAVTDDQLYSSIRYKGHRQVHKEKELQNQPNTVHLRTTPSISENSLFELRKLAQQIELYFGKPMDIEFVIKNETIYVVQVRPIRNVKIENMPTYLDPDQFLNRFRGQTIVPGVNQAMFVSGMGVLFAESLDEAEVYYQPKVHQVVVVCTHEKNTTHPAVNFASQRPPVPCFFLSPEQWNSCKSSRVSGFHMCPQTGTIVPTMAKLVEKQGLFRHPAQFPISVGTGKPIQGESGHSLVVKLGDLLNKTSESLIQSTHEIETGFNQLFLELEARESVPGPLREKMNELKKAVFAEVGSMKSAGVQKQFVKVVFHAGMLKQLLNQSESDVEGAHSISGIEVATNFPVHFKSFMKKHSSSEVMCELAQLGLKAFDESIQENWLKFLEQSTDLESMKTLAGLLREWDSANMLSFWFSTYFMKPFSFGLKPLIESQHQDEQSLRSIKNFQQETHLISQNLGNISSMQDLEIIWKQLEALSNEVMLNCASNPLRFPILLDLIDLWDLSTKAVKTSHLFNEKEESEVFGKRVGAFIDFARKASEKKLLRYSLENFIAKMNKYGSDRYQFSVEHWMKPISRGALSELQTDDQRLTVIHQNLLQAATFGTEELLPVRLRKAFELFTESSTTEAKRFSKKTGTYFSITENQALVRVNILLNYHSTVVTLTQDRGQNDVKITAYFRGSDNDRVQHIDFFRMFARLTEITLKSWEGSYPNLKVIFSTKNEEEISLVSKAINRVNAMSIYSVNNVKSLCHILGSNEEEKKEIREKVLKYVWDDFVNTGTLATSFFDELAIWGYCKENDLYEHLKTRVLDELQGKREPSDFSKQSFIRGVLRMLDLKIVEDAVGKAINAGRLTSLNSIPKDAIQGVVNQLILKNPVKAKKYYESYTEIEYADFMNERIKSKKIESVEEVDLLLHMTLKSCFEEKVPSEDWLQVLEKWKEPLIKYMKEHAEERGLERYFFKEQAKTMGAKIAVEICKEWLALCQNSFSFKF